MKHHVRPLLITLFAISVGCSNTDKTVGESTESPSTSSTSTTETCGDSDGDGVCDDVDACAGEDDTVDSDGDGVADGCDACPLDATDDSDGDGVCDSDDACAGHDDTVDGDADGVADGCDACPLDATDDSDGDGACDSDDICPGGDDLVDSDLDGTPDDCDLCPESDVLDEFNWVTWDPISGNVATGLVGDVGVTYSSSSTLQATAGVYGYGTFPAEYGIPNVNPTIQNVDATTNTLTFDRPVSDPLLVFASVGTAGLAVPIQFDRPIELEFQTALSGVTIDSFIGNEGYAVVRVPGVHSSISFDYLTAEYYVNFVFGFGGTTDDTDGDGVPDVCDFCPLDPGCS